MIRRRVVLPPIAENEMPPYKITLTKKSRKDGNINLCPFPGLLKILEFFAFHSFVLWQYWTQFNDIYCSCNRIWLWKWSTLFITDICWVMVPFYTVSENGKMLMTHMKRQTYKSYLRWSSNFIFHQEIDKKIYSVISSVCLFLCLHVTLFVWTTSSIPPIRYWWIFTGMINRWRCAYGFSCSSSIIF